MAIKLVLGQRRRVIRERWRVWHSVNLTLLFAIGCTGVSSSDQGTLAQASGGQASQGGIGGATSAGQVSTGGNVGTGGTAADGGLPAIGTTASGGTVSASGTIATGGTGNFATVVQGGGQGVTVHLERTHQIIEGFGINDTWAWENLPSRLFDTTDADGLGLSILRIGMGDNGQDYSSNIAGDIKTAKAAGAKIIGTCWSPPASCKSNNGTNDSGHLLSSCYESWSDTIVSWAKGHGLYAMSLQTEPDYTSCLNEPCDGYYPTTLFTASEMVAFVKVAGPKLQAAGIKVIAPEPSEWNHLWSNISTAPAGNSSSDPLQCGCFGMTIDDATAAKCSSTCTSGGGYDYGHWLAKDADAWKAFDIIGVHEYDSQTGYAWPSDVAGGKRDKEIWQTEVSGVKWWPEQGPSGDIANGVAVAGWIHSALVTGEASAWLWWWYRAYATDDNEGLLLESGTVTKRYYTLGNYSKFVRPGYVMVDVVGNGNANLLLSAFKGSDGTVVVVAINKSTATFTVPITIAGGTVVPTSMTPNVTSSSESLKAGPSISVNGGTFLATLPGTTVTTFVGR